MATMTDPQFVAAAQKSKLEINPLSGADVAALVNGVFKTVSPGGGGADQGNPLAELAPPVWRQLQQRHRIANATRSSSVSFSCSSSRPAAAALPGTE